MSPKWKWFLIGYLWALPHLLLIGIPLALIYRCRSWRWSGGCLEAIAGEKNGETRIWGRPWAQTHGWFIIYDNEEHRERTSLRVHERCHVVQGFVGGPLYPVAYGICFLIQFVKLGFKDWKRAYRKNPFEVVAYDRQDLPNRWS